MTAAFLAAAVVPARAQTSADAHMLDLSCVEALVAIKESRLAGVFSFVPDKDAPQAFADLLVHDRKALKRYLAKLARDDKQAGGISSWDHQVVGLALQIYASPIAGTVEKPGSLKGKLEGLSGEPSLSLEQITTRRKSR